MKRNESLKSRLQNYRIELPIDVLGVLFGRRNLPSTAHRKPSPRHQLSATSMPDWIPIQPIPLGALSGLSAPPWKYQSSMEREEVSEPNRLCSISRIFRIEKRIRAILMPIIGGRNRDKYKCGKSRFIEGYGEEGGRAKRARRKFKAETRTMWKGVKGVRRLVETWAKLVSHD